MREKQSKTHPGRCERNGMSLVKLIELFPNNKAAEDWFELQRWPVGICCPDCGSLRYSNVKHRKPMPYRCKDCRGYFSVRKGTVMQSSKLSYQKWAIAIYLVATSLKGVSSMKLHRDLKIRQPSAWHLAQRIREGFTDGIESMTGPVEVDEVYIGGKEKNKHDSEKLRAGRGTVGKTAVVGIKDRESNKITAMPMPSVNQNSVGELITQSVSDGATVYSDESHVYNKLDNHEAVNHSTGEYVRGMAHTNGIESFWSILKRGYYGTFHHLSKQHLHRYVNEFAGRHNIRGLDTIHQMTAIARGMDHKLLRYRDLVR